MTDLTEDAENALAKVQDKASRTHVDSVACEEAFKALVDYMRSIKNHYFNPPPRTAVELGLVGLTKRNIGSSIPKPENQVGGKTRPLGDHLIQVEFEIIGDMVKDTKASDYGIRVYVAIEDPAAAPGAMGKYGPYHPTAPLSGPEFSWSFFTHRRREIFDFEETDRSKRCWFIAYLEREKGGQDGIGPWGPLFWTVIP